MIEGQEIAGDTTFGNLDRDITRAGLGIISMGIQRLSKVRIRIGRPGARDHQETKLFYNIYNILYKEERKGKQ
jgi:hypothetical protein